MQVNQPNSGTDKATTRTKTVTRHGMTFTVISSRERVVSAQGRHFFCAGRDCDGWTLFEHDSDFLKTGITTLIGRRFERIENTKLLVAEIQKLLATNEKLPTDVRPPWVIDQARHDLSMRNFAAKRLTALEHGETTIYHTLRWCGRVVREFCFTTAADEFDGESTGRMNHHFHTDDLPAKYKAEGRPVDWIRAALDDGFQFKTIYANGGDV